MNLPKFVRIVALSLIVAATTLPASAAQLCSCDFCQRVAPQARCDFEGLEGNERTTCGAFLIVALCPAE
ncbi:MAG TPA: hypothetical protein VLQ45_19265 [Thermoanaerobaculia bacterium]|nr:hypothetical protein [Thermoanaerobaculia bacterium]